jgi:phosphoesterase RecJ-like protein
MTTHIHLLHGYLTQAHTCAIIGHVNPDGDALGAALAMRRWLSQAYPHIAAKVILPNRFPAYFGWMDGTADIGIFTDTYTNAASKAAAIEGKQLLTNYLHQCDTIICVDFNALYRLEELGRIVAPLPARKILIDHHPSPAADFDLLLSDPAACSTCEVLYRIITTINPSIITPTTSPASPTASPTLLAESLYTGMFTDTGGFAYNVKRSDVFRIAANLIDAGIDKDAIAARVNDSYSVHRMRLLGYALKDKMTLVEGKPAAYIALSQQELSAYHFETGDTEGLVNMPLSIRDIALSAFFYESNDKSHIRISLRTKGDTLSANDIARQHFSGGGHFNAAGGKFFGTLQKCCQYFESIAQTLFATIVILICLQCSTDAIKPQVAAVSYERQSLLQANMYWSKRQHDIIEAFLRRHDHRMTAHKYGFYLQVNEYGKGTLVVDGSETLVEAEIYLLDGTLCYAYEGRQALRITIGHSDAAISGMHSALRGLRAGSEAVALFGSHLGMGTLGDRRCVPPHSPLLCRFKIMEVI